MLRLLGGLAVVVVAGCASQPRFGADITMDLVSDESLCAQMKVSEAQGEQNVANLLMPKEDARKEAAAIREELKRRNPAWPWDTIDQGKIRVGMTETQAICSWGSPVQVNRASYGDQWVYPGHPAAQYLYFKSGVLDAFN